MEDVLNTVHTILPNFHTHPNALKLCITKMADAAKNKRRVDKILKEMSQAAAEGRCELLSRFCHSLNHFASGRNVEYFYEGDIDAPGATTENCTALRKFFLDALETDSVEMARDQLGSVSLCARNEEEFRQRRTNLREKTRFRFGQVLEHWGREQMHQLAHNFENLKDHCTGVRPTLLQLRGALLSANAGPTFERIGQIMEHAFDCFSPQLSTSSFQLAHQTTRAEIEEVIQNLAYINKYKPTSNTYRDHFIDKTVVLELTEGCLNLGRETGRMMAAIEDLERQNVVTDFCTEKLFPEKIERRMNAPYVKGHYRFYLKMYLLTGLVNWRCMYNAKKYPQNPTLVGFPQKIYDDDVRLPQKVQTLRLVSYLAYKRGIFLDGYYDPQKDPKVSYVVGNGMTIVNRKANGSYSYHNIDGDHSHFNDLVHRINSIMEELCEVDFDTLVNAMRNTCFSYGVRGWQSCERRSSDRLSCVYFRDIECRCSLHFTRSRICCILYPGFPAASG